VPRGDGQADGLDVAVLGEGIEGNPEAETVGEGDLLLQRLALLQLAVDEFTPQVSVSYSGRRWRRLEVT